MAKITVKDQEITVIKVDSEDYISLTDMLRAKDGDFFISDWLRNRNTIEYLGIWEKIYNPNFITPPSKQNNNHYPKSQYLSTFRW